MYHSNLVELLYILACLLTAHYTFVWLIVVGLGSFACTVLVVGGMNAVVYSCGPLLAREGMVQFSPMDHLPVGECIVVP